MDVTGNQYRSPFEGLSDTALSFKKRIISQFLESPSERQKEWASLVRRGKNRGFLTNYSLELPNLEVSNISSVPFDVFAKYIQLLSLRGNKIRQVGEGQLNGFTSLEYLGLQDNHIEYIHEQFMNHSTTLKGINLENNLLTRFPRSILLRDRFPNLQEINLKGNSLSQDEIDQLWALNRLQGSKIRLLV